MWEAITGIVPSIGQTGQSFVKQPQPTNNNIYFILSKQAIYLPSSLELNVFFVKNQIFSYYFYKGL